MLYEVAIALGSNLGDRQGNLVAALQKLRAYVDIGQISSLYETTPVGYAEQPDFLNLTCTGKTALSAHELHDALKKIERQVGRRSVLPLGPRAIDLDLLLYGDKIIEDEKLKLPHHGLTWRAFVLVPLAEIAPQLTDPHSGLTIAELAAAADRSGVRRREGGLLTRIRRDVQDSPPPVPLSLNRVGVTGVKTMLALDERYGRTQSAIATFDIFADLDAGKSGLHMSRFSQDIEDVLTEIAQPQAGGIDALAMALAQRVVESQQAESSQVDVRAEIASPRYTPASALRTHEFYTVFAKAVVGGARPRRILGVQAAGITACPCAQQMVSDYSRERLLAEGFSEAQIARILSSIPIATHNQRAIGTLMIGSDEDVDVAAMLEIVEQSMSSETYDLLKRPDELFVVNKAHFTPRFVEDAVREMLHYAYSVFSGMPASTFVLARQVSYESIHKHDAMAESCATLGELRAELNGAVGVAHSTLEQWLHSAAAAAPTP